jgi:molybdopterin molybdotransferase
MKGFFQLISSQEFIDLFEGYHPLGQETLTLDQGLGRVLAQEITAPENLPPHARSTMDGFGVRARDTFGCSESEPALLKVNGEIKMGTPGQDHKLKTGETVRIWTGGELPDKGDAVVMVEYSRMLDEGTVELFRPVAPGENVIQAGDDYKKGDPVLDAGSRLRPQDLGVLAGLGFNRIPVYKKPQVAIISTGDELVPPDQDLVPGKIRDINSTTLAGLVRESGGIPRQLGIIRDDLELMQTACKDALADGADMLLLSGGSSVGKRDFTLKVLEGLENTKILAHGVAIRPGKPTILGKQDNRAFFGLPGHVASAIVVFYLFVRPLLRIYSGLGPGIGLQSIQVRAGEQLPSTIGREEFVRVRLEPAGDDLPLAHPVYGKSGLINPLVAADGLLVIERDREGLDKGQVAQVLLFP